MAKKRAKRVFSTLLLFLLAAVPFITLASSGAALTKIPLDIKSLWNGDTTAALEQTLKSSFPLRHTLRGTLYTLRQFGGQKEIEGIFITGERLIENTSPPRNSAVKRNIEAIAGFAQQERVPTFTVLVPTASAVLRDQLPQAAPYNQKAFIDEVYEQLNGKATTIDAYSLLYAHAEDYIYYRTDSSLTTYGGYLVYQPVLAKLRRQQAVSLDRFELEHVVHDYYGDLYERLPDVAVTGDTITLYHYQEFQREFKVTHYQDGERKIYYEIYPRQMLTLDSPEKLLFGGLSQVIEVETSSPNEETLLVFADESILPYLSFLSIHYRSITVVNTAQADEELLNRLDVKAYDQVLCSYYADSFMTTTGPARMALAYRNKGEL